MKKSLLVLVVLSLLTLPTFAREEPRPRERRDPGIIKIIKRVFGIQTTGDYLTPPRP